MAWRKESCRETNFGWGNTVRGAALADERIRMSVSRRTREHSAVGHKKCDRAETRTTAAAPSCMPSSLSRHFHVDRGSNASSREDTYPSFISGTSWHPRTSPSGYYARAPHALSSGTMTHHPLVLTCLRGLSREEATWLGRTQEISMGAVLLVSFRSFCSLPFVSSNVHFFFAQMDGQEFSQSTSILRYVGGLAGLIPSEPIAALKVRFDKPCDVGRHVGC